MTTPLPLLARSLKLGDTIGFFSPSSPVTVSAPERYARAKKYLGDKGFQLKAGSQLENLTIIDRELFNSALQSSTN